MHLCSHWWLLLTYAKIAVLIPPFSCCLDSMQYHWWGKMTHALASSSQHASQSCVCDWSLIQRVMPDPNTTPPPRIRNVIASLTLPEIIHPVVWAWANKMLLRWLWTCHSDADSLCPLDTIHPWILQNQFTLQYDGTISWRAPLTYGDIDGTGIQSSVHHMHSSSFIDSISCDQHETGLCDQASLKGGQMKTQWNHQHVMKFIVQTAKCCCSSSPKNHSWWFKSHQWKYWVFG